MERVLKAKVIEDIKQIFNIEEVQEMSNVSETSYLIEEKGVFGFYISKNKFERNDVIKMLSDYFTNRVVIGGGCSIDPITLLHTGFRIWGKDY